MFFVKNREHAFFLDFRFYCSIVASGPSIVRSLIELHGGTFELQSELRRGTTAIVVFPAERVMSAMRPILPFGEERLKQRTAWSIIKGPRPVDGTTKPRLRLFQRERRV